ncbi:MAG TPA: amino acid--tRNA ligase-related protein, partial [Woeseiaceae bacterium]
PAEQAALARVNPDDPAVADRFEVFRGDLELANGYVELGDAAEQRERCNRDQAARQTLGKTIRPLDRDFLDALQHGLPACAGVAVGFDRLVMIAASADHIGKVTSFIFNAERHT